MQKFFESVELRFPEGAVLRDPGGSVFHGVGVQAAAVDAPINFASQQPGGFEDAEVLGDGGEGHVKRLGELGDFGLALSEAGEDSAAGGVGKSAESGVEGGGIVNHMV